MKISVIALLFAFCISNQLAKAETPPRTPPLSFASLEEAKKYASKLFAGGSADILKTGNQDVLVLEIYGSGLPSLGFTAYTNQNGTWKLASNLRPQPVSSFYKAISENNAVMLLDEKTNKKCTLLVTNTDIKNTIIERSPALKNPHLLGTGFYVPLKSEVKFYEKIPEKDRETVSSFSTNEKAFYESAFFKQNNPNATTESINAKKPSFSLSGHVGEYVSWFGILRAAEKNNGCYNLIIQNKYSQGLTDLHIQTVSIWGAGDFDAVVHCQDFSLNPLVLVKVYGKVTGEIDGRPVVDVEYLRYWNWLYFNFQDFGEDKKLSAYDKDLDLTGLRIYRSRVDPDYYAQRIQATREQLDIISKWISDSRDARIKEYQDVEKEE